MSRFSSKAVAGVAKDSPKICVATPGITPVKSQKVVGILFIIITECRTFSTNLRYKQITLNNIYYVDVRFIHICHNYYVAVATRQFISARDVFLPLYNYLFMTT